MSKPIKAILTLALLSAIALFLVAKDKLLPGEKNPHASVLEAEKKLGDKTPTADQKRALQLLDQIFESANRLKHDDQGWNYDLKIMLQAQIADAVWDYDQARARRLFEEAFRPIKQDLPKDAVTVSAGMKLNFMVVGNSSNSILRLIVRRDPDLPERLFGKDSNYRAVEYKVATFLVDSDPRRAAEIIKRSYDKDKEVTSMSRFLVALRQKDQALSDELFGYVLSKAPKDNEELYDYFTELSGYVFEENRNSEGDRSFHSIPQKEVQVNPALLARYLDLAYNAMMVEARLAQAEAKERNSMNERLGFGYMNVRSALLYLEKYMPDKAAEIRERWDEALRSVPEGQKHIDETDFMMTRFANIEWLLSEAEKTQDTEIKENLYRPAWKIAIEMKDFDKAFSIIEKISSKETQAELKWETYYGAARVALDEGDLSRAYSFGKNISDIESRAEIYSLLAQALKDKNETARATGIIREIVPLIAKEKHYFIRVHAMMTVANAAARLDPAFGFEVMKSTVTIINDPKAGADGGRISWLNFNQNLRLLARTDFEQALRLAQSIKAKEQSMLAQVAACRGILIQMDAE